MLIQRSLIYYCRPIHKLFRTLMLSSPAVASPPTLTTRHVSYSHHRRRFLVASSQKPASKFRSLSLQPDFSPRPISQVDPKIIEERSIASLSTLNVLAKKLEQIGVEISPFTPGQHDHLLCPQCNGGTSTELSLSVAITGDGNTALFKCFRAKCGWEGCVKAFADSKSTYEKMIHTPKVKKIRTIKEESLELEPLCNELLAYFAERTISRDTLKRNTVMQRRYGDQIAIAFPYRRNGVLVSCKYRDINKNFWQEADVEKIFYGLDDIKDKTDIIIVEGEMDKLAMEEAGFRNCVSVPDGAPPAVSDKELPSQDQDTKYQYLWNCKEYLKKASRIILATDGDAPGQALAEELARRIGRERCWRVKWPKKNDVSNFKDANEVLMYMGPVVLKEVIENAELYPIKGLFNFRDYFDEIDAYYHRTLANDLGVSTGWRAMNALYNVQEHARKLLEKHIKKPFFDTRYGEFGERMNVDELEQGKKWLNDTFHLIRCENDCLPSIDWVLNLAKSAVLRHGVNGLVIDPYNELDHQRLSSMTETEYVSQMLTKVKRFAQHHSCHVWFVAHPKQLQHWAGQAPNLYDISGSAHFINKCDNGIVIHRNRNPDAGPMDQVQVCVRKVRNKVVGTIGEALLSYDRVTGEYKDLE